MSDKIESVTVEKEALRRYPLNHTVDDPEGETGYAETDPYGYEEYGRRAFVAGAEWGAATEGPVEYRLVFIDANGVSSSTAIASLELARERIAAGDSTERQIFIERRPVTTWTRVEGVEK